MHAVSPYRTSSSLKYSFQELIAVRAKFTVLVLISTWANYSFGIDDGVAADHAPSERIPFFLTPEERLESIVDADGDEGLELSALVEIENGYRQNKLPNGRTEWENDELVETLEIGIDYKPFDWMALEAIGVLEHEERLYGEIEEAIVAIMFVSSTLSLGKIDLPFGEYYSHFVTGPMLEFGEITREALAFEFMLNEGVSVHTYGFRSESPNRNSLEVDWGLGLTWASNDDSIRIGLDYLSDLTEVDDVPIEIAEHDYDGDVPAGALHLFIGDNWWEVTFEWIQSLRSFSIIDAKPVLPSAQNVEFAYLIDENWQIALRIERSNELADEPSWKYGIANSLRIGNSLSLRMDALYGRYTNEPEINDDNAGVSSVYEAGVSLSYEF